MAGAGALSWRAGSGCGFSGSCHSACPVRLAKGAAVRSAGKPSGGGERTSKVGVDDGGIDDGGIDAGAGTMGGGSFGAGAIATSPASARWRAVISATARSIGESRSSTDLRSASGAGAIAGAWSAGSRIMLRRGACGAPVNAGAR